MLVADAIYFADPSTFNDPLDAKPTLKTDLPADELANILTQLVEQRVSAEMTAVAKTIKYQGPKTLDHIARHSRKTAAQLIDTARYNASDSDLTAHDREQFVFGQHIEGELLRRYEKGIFSLAERPECPLMWSHYGDQHKGICLGYSVPNDASAQPHQVDYFGRRQIRASVVAAMLKGEADAQHEVDKTALLRKAHAWNYEKEWRLIGKRGQHDSMLELKEVVFGMRCSSSVIYAVVKALEERSRDVRFYEIREKNNTGYSLQKRVLNVDELKASYPRCNRDIIDSFSEIENSSD